MSKPTKNRQELRHSLQLELGSEFRKRFATNPLVTTGSNISPSDSANVLTSDFWNNGWFYVAETSTGGAPLDESRKISGYSSGVYTLEYALSTDVLAGASYEIMDVFSPNQVHDSMNRAIQEAYPSFYDVINDETLIVEHDKMTYSLSGLSSRPWTVVKVYVERNRTVMDGLVDSSTVNTIVDSNGSFSEVESGWLVSIYRGTGSGQLRTVDSVVSSTITVTENWTTNPDDTSYYRVWNPNEEEIFWRQLMDVRFDQKQYPEKMYLYRSLNGTGVEGLRFRLQFTTMPAELEADTDLTVVPQEYIINKTLGLLYGSRAGRTNLDQRRFEMLEDRYHAKADMYRRNHAFRPPDITMWMEEDSRVSNSPDDNPMNWR